MRYLLAAALALGLAAGAVPGTAQAAQSKKAGALEIEQAWTRATPPGAPTGGGYLTITNTGTEPDRLVSASSPKAGKVEVHQMKMNDGMMTMRPVEGGLPIPAGESVELRPGGLHLMMMQLDGRIEEGATVPVTLVFEKTGEVTLEMKAAPIGASVPEMEMHGHGHGGPMGQAPGGQMEHGGHGR